jgi:hypothetical protein
MSPLDPTTAYGESAVPGRAALPAGPRRRGLALVSRRHVDFGRTASAICRAGRV